jgi:hypothetical protein
MQAARPELDVLEDLTIRSKRCVVVDTARHVGPMTRVYFPVRRFLEIKHVERACSIRDHLRTLR